MPRPSATHSPKDGGVYWRPGWRRPCSPWDVVQLRLYRAWGWSGVVREHGLTLVVPRCKLPFVRQPSGMGVGRVLPLGVLGPGPLSSAAGVVAVGMESLPDATPSWNCKPEADPDAHATIIWVAAPPCQDFSFITEGKGHDRERGGLFLHTINVMLEVQQLTAPRRFGFLYENVATPRRSQTPSTSNPSTCAHQTLGG